MDGPTTPRRRPWETAFAQLRAELTAMVATKTKGEPGAQGASAQLPATGTAKTSSLITLGGFQDVVVALDRTMPNSTYAVSIIPSATILGSGTTTVQARTTTTVTVRITATIAIALGAQVTVLAFPTS